jgi:hypothetical protein
MRTCIQSKGRREVQGMMEIHERFLFCFVLFFVSIGRRSREGVQMFFFFFIFWGNTLRLAASRVCVTRCLESALDGADPGLSLVASGS